MRVAGFGVVLLILAGVARSELKDEIHVNPKKTEGIRMQKLKGAENLASSRAAKPAGAVKVQVTVELRITDPKEVRDLAEVSKRLKTGEALFRLAVAHISKSTETAKEACCSRLSDGNACWWWCCGDRTDECQDECELLYCDAKAKP